jgi:hypothetical protein
MADEENRHLRLMFGLKAAPKQKASGDTVAPKTTKRTMSGKEQFRPLAEKHWAFAGFVMSSMNKLPGKPTTQPLSADGADVRPKGEATDGPV